MIELNPFSRPLLAASLMVLLASPLTAQQESADAPDPAAVDDDSDALFQRSMNELFETSNTIVDEAGADTPMTFSGSDQPRWLQGLTVTRSENPMLEQACREQALASNTQRLMDQGAYDGESETLRATLEHMHMHHEFIRDNRISYAEYLKSLAQCTEFCAPLVASLMNCHVLSVARRPHGIVLFDLGSSRVDARFRDGVIREMAGNYLDDPERNILLVGRASQIGDLAFNRRLAAQRALAVRDELTAGGVPFERIRPIWFGWEPPQIDPMVADEYGFDELLAEHGRDAVNQSVVMVIF